MKLVVSIISSSQSEYLGFKQIWIENIKYIKSQPDIKDLVDFYFLNCEKDIPITSTIVPVSSNGGGTPFYYEFYNYYDEDIRQRRVLKKTLNFFTYAKGVYENVDETTFFIRSNLSTLINFRELINWLKTRPNKMFFAGPVVDNFKGRDSILSGTHLIMSFDVMVFLITHYINIWIGLHNYNCSLTVKENTEEERINFYVEDDTIISNVLFKLSELRINNVPRLDFIDIYNFEITEGGETRNINTNLDLVLFHKCNEKDNIFTYRFKTKSRETDIINMRNIFNHIKTNSVTFYLQEFINKGSHNVLIQGDYLLNKEPLTLNEIEKK